MKVVQIAQVGGPEVLKIASVAIPDLKPGHIRVKNAFVGINFIDTYHRSGLYKVTLPYVPGREGSGLVEAVGEGVTGFKVNDRVAFTAPNSCAEYSVVPSGYAIHLPDEVSFEFGAALLLQGLTALSMATLAYTVKPKDTVLIHAAAGGTGLMLTQVCKHLGATVIGTTSTPEKASVAQSAGADHVILYTKEDILTRVHELTGGKGVEAVFDGIGKTTFDTSLSCLKRHGSLLSFGNASGKVDPIDIMKLVPRAVKLMRPSMFELITTSDEFSPLAAQLLAMVRDKKLSIHVHKVYPFENVSDAHRDLEGKGTFGKLLLQV